MLDVARCWSPTPSSPARIPNHADYWAEAAVIRFDEYPYSACKIYEAKGGSNLYLVYREFGGHVPEWRCRLVRESLIDFASLPPAGRAS